MIIGGGVGMGISVKMLVVGGIDLLVIYNFGCFWMVGRGLFLGLMFYGDVN